MRRTEQATKRAAIGLALTWALLGAGCKTTIQTHPPMEERIERMREQVRQMESQTSEDDRRESSRPARDQVQQ